MRDRGSDQSARRRVAEPEHRREAAEALAVRALAFLAADQDSFGRFLSLSGIGPGDVRRAAADPAFLGAVIDHLLSEPALLRAFEAAELVSAADLDRARRVLLGDDWEPDVP